MKYSKIHLIYGSGGSDKIVLGTPYKVRDISGLEPPSIVVNIEDQLYEGGLYQGRRPDNREIIVTLGFAPNYGLGQNVADLRKSLYVLLAPKLDVPLTIKLLTPDETEYVTTKGYIKRIEASIFSKDPAVQITLSCLSPYFELPLYTHPSPSSMDADNPLLITNPGDAPCGFLIKIVLGPTGPPPGGDGFTLTRSGTTQKIQFDYDFFSSDDLLILDTRVGSRMAILAETLFIGEVNLLQHMTVDSVWLQLEPGVNSFVPSTTEYAISELTFTPRHWGF